MIFTYILFIVIAGFFIAIGYYIMNGIKQKNRQSSNTVTTASLNFDPSLLQHISFYRALNGGEKKIFENEVSEFLSRVHINGVDAKVEELDRVLIASSAVIPLFAFPDWFYPNLLYVDLYKDAFNGAFETDGANRRILGMVGSGMMNGRMALSQKALRIGFSNETDKRNTAIHEFVHLMDMSDGATDGVPEILLDKHSALPWLEYIRKEIERIREGESDINPYGGKNETEFFAVAAEYFLNDPNYSNKSTHSFMN